MPSVPTTTDNRQGYIAAAIVVWSVPPFPSPRAWTFPAVGNVETGAGRPRADLGWLYEPRAVAPLVLLKQDATKLCQRVRSRIIERPGTRSRSATVSATTSVFIASAFSRKEARRLVDDSYEFAHVILGDPQTGEIYKGVGTL